MLPIIDARSYKGGDKGSVHSMSPLLSTSYQKSTTSFLEGGRFPEYLRRLCDFRQMDFEAAFDQMITLLSFEPQKVLVLCMIMFWSLFNCLLMSLFYS